MRRRLSTLLLIAILTACAPAATAPPPVVQTVEVEVTRIAEVTRDVVRTVQVTQLVTAEVTRLVEVPVPVTVTPTATPQFTPTITPIPSATPPPSQTPNKALTVTANAAAALRSAKGDGFYLIGRDIAPGVWRSTTGYDRCYWATTKSSGSIIRNHYGDSGGTAFIGPNDFQVEFNGCGRWEWLSAP